MRASFGLGMAAAVWLAAAGCSDAHQRTGDAGPILGDAGPPTGCQPGDTAPFGAYCVSVSNHVCGDASFPPTCVDGAWMCPIGTTHEAYAECWCSGFGGGGPGCTCTPSGWACPVPLDAGVDAGPAFACGPLECGRFTEVCQHVVSDVVGQPDGWRCAPLPEDCASDCSCFGGGEPNGTCSDDGAGAVTVVLGGA